MVNANLYSFPYSGFEGKRWSEDKLDGEFGKIVNISIFWKTPSDFNIIHTHLLETDVLQFDFYISLNCSGMR